MLALWTCFLLPGRFLSFPGAAPGAWAACLALYPLMAAYPQEIVFLGFFFHRYRDLFPGTVAMVAASSLSFGLAHLIYGNWVAPVLSGLGGLVFGYRPTSAPAPWSSPRSSTVSGATSSSRWGSAGTSTRRILPGPMPRRSEAQPR